MSAPIRAYSRSIAALAALAIVAGWHHAAQAQETSPAANSAAPAAEDVSFEVPPGGAAEKLAFIQALAHPTRQFTSAEETRTYLREAATAIGTATEQILAGEATDEQATDAVQWKINSLRILGQLGDQEADRKTDEFLDSLQQDKRPAVVSAVLQLRLMRKVGRWNQLDAAERVETINRYVAGIKETGLTRGNAKLMIHVADVLADSPDSALAVKAVSELLPLFERSSDSALAEHVPILEGMLRRMNLPGNKMELTGTLLDGSQFDWEAYRGKVVLVDFWATWCGPCREEVPNIIQNYNAYRDKGFEVVGISLDEERGQAEKYMQDTGMGWPTLFSDDPEATGWDHPMARKYAITGIPRAILVDRDGVVVSMMARGALLEAELRKLLGEPNTNQAAAPERERRQPEEVRTARGPSGAAAGSPQP